MVAWATVGSLRPPVYRLGRCLTDVCVSTFFGQGPSRPCHPQSKQQLFRVSDRGCAFNITLKLGRGDAHALVLTWRRQIQLYHSQPEEAPQVQRMNSVIEPSHFRSCCSRGGDFYVFMFVEHPDVRGNRWASRASSRGIMLGWEPSVQYQTMRMSVSGDFVFIVSWHNAWKCCQMSRNKSRLGLMMRDVKLLLEVFTSLRGSNVNPHNSMLWLSPVGSHCRPSWCNIFFFKTI